MLERHLYQSIVDFFIASGHYAGHFESSAALGSKKSVRRRKYCPTGWPDVAGYLSDGRVLLCEVKKPEELSHGLSLIQAIRLLHGIDCGGFAICVDGVQRARLLLLQWQNIKLEKQKKLWLLSQLPPKYNVKGRRFELASLPAYIRIKKSLYEKRITKIEDPQ